MAENTRLKELAADLKRVSDTLAVHDQQGAETKQQLQRVESTLAAIQLALDTITRSVDHLASAPPTGVSNSPPPMRSVRLDFPKFDGSDPLNWLFRAEQFFAYYATQDSQRLTIAAVHFEGSVVPNVAEGESGVYMGRSCSRSGRTIWAFSI